jgi:hypothetical protein
MGKSRFIDKPHESDLRLRCSDLLEECRPFFRARLGVIEGFFVCYIQTPQSIKHAIFPHTKAFSVLILLRIGVGFNIALEGLHVDPVGFLTPSIFFDPNITLSTPMPKP